MARDRRRPAGGRRAHRGAPVLRRVDRV